MASPSPTLGTQPHPKTAIAIISGTAKARDFKFGSYIHRVHPNTKILDKRERGRIKRRPNFLISPIISGKGKSYELQIWQVYS